MEKKKSILLSLTSLFLGSNEVKYFKKQKALVSLLKALHMLFLPRTSSNPVWWLVCSYGSLCCSHTDLPCLARLSQDLRTCHAVCMEHAFLRYCTAASLTSFRSLLKCHLIRKTLSGHNIQSNLQIPGALHFLQSMCAVSLLIIWLKGLLGGSVVKNLPGQCRFDPWVRKIPWRKKWKPAPVFLLGQFHRLRRLAGYKISVPWEQELCFVLL